jgi:hypothetical protein
MPFLFPRTPDSAESFTIERKVGRLVQTRLPTLRDLSEMREMQDTLLRVLREVKGQVVICTDWTMLDVFSPELAQSVYEMLATTNSKVLRGAILLNAEKATFNLQVERVIREARNPSRRTFRSSHRMLDWLSEVLEPEEVASATEFLMRN